MYFDYVPSKANIADLPSRQEYTIPRAMGARVTYSYRAPTRAELVAGDVEWFRRGNKYGAGKQWPV